MKIPNCSLPEISPSWVCLLVLTDLLVLISRILFFFVTLFWVILGPKVCSPDTLHSTTIFIGAISHELYIFIYSEMRLFYFGFWLESKGRSSWFLGWPYQFSLFKLNHTHDNYTVETISSSNYLKFFDGSFLRYNPGNKEEFFLNTTKCCKGTLKYLKIEVRKLIRLKWSSRGQSTFVLGLRRPDIHVLFALSVYSGGRAKKLRVIKQRVWGAAPPKNWRFFRVKRPNWGWILACGFISVTLYWWKEYSKAVNKHWSWIEMTE